MEPDLVQTRGGYGTYARSQSGRVGKCQRQVALTAPQRRRTILEETISWAQRRLLDPAVRPVLEFCRPRHISSAHLAWLSEAAAVVAGSVLIFAGESPLVRFWAGIFLWSALAVECAARGMREPSQIVDSTPANIRRIAAIGAIAAIIVIGVIETAALIAGSGWIWLAGIAATIGAAVQVTAYDAAWRQYAHAAGAGIPEERDNLFELSLNQRAAEMRECRNEARFWRAYTLFRRAQQFLVPWKPAGSADAFWKNNRRRMALWTLFAPWTICCLLSAAMVLSSFWPPALSALFLTLAVPGNFLLLLLLLLGWKIRPVSGYN